MAPREPTDGPMAIWYDDDKEEEEGEEEKEKEEGAGGLILPCGE